MWRERLIRHFINYSNATRNDISEIVDSPCKRNEVTTFRAMMVIRRMTHRFQTEEIKRISFIKRRV